MGSLELLACAAKTTEQPLRLDLVSGHSVLLHVLAVGAGWLTGEILEGPKRGAVVPWGSVCSAWPGEFNAEFLAVADSPRSTDRLGLDAPLRELARLAKSITLYTDGASWRGRIRWAGFDCLCVNRLDGSEVVVPYSAVFWVAVE